MFKIPVNKVRDTFVNDRCSKKPPLLLENTYIKGLLSEVLLHRWKFSPVML